MAELKQKLLKKQKDEDLEGDLSSYLGSHNQAPNESLDFQMDPVEHEEQQTLQQMLSIVPDEDR